MEKNGAADATPATPLTSSLAVYRVCYEKKYFIFPFPTAHYVFFYITIKKSAIALFHHKDFVSRSKF